MTLSQYIGESRTHRVKLTDLGQPFDPAGWTLLFSVKYDPLHDDDTQALFQKTSGAGLETATIGGEFFADVSAVPQDTDGKLPILSSWDIKARKNATGENKIVAKGRFELKQAVTRGNDPATPIHTTQPLAPDHVLTVMAENLTASEAAKTAAESAAVSAGASATTAAAAATAAAADAQATAADRVQTALDRVATGQDRTATAADAAATAADRVQTTADRAQTALDRVATGQDRTATQADAQQTAADKLATAADVLATAGDRTATGEDRVATAADRAATAADAQQTGADRVQTGLDRVATASDRAIAYSAASAAVGAANSASADAAATAADRVQTGLDRTQTGEDRTATGADRTAVAADRVQTGEDRTAVAADKATAAAAAITATNAANSAASDALATGADRVATGEDRTQTGADRVQTGEDRDDAEASATAAAASAATALNAIAGQFKGGLAGSAVPATSPLAGDTYRITSAGTSQSKTWAIGDAAIYDGTSGAWTQLTGFYLSLARAEELAGYREASGYLWCDGVTSGRGQIQIPGPRGNLSGAPVASWVGWVNVPEVSAGNLSSIAQISPVSGHYVGNNANPGLGIEFTNDVLAVRTHTGYDANSRKFIYSNFRTINAGKDVWLEVRLTKGTSNPVVRVDGVDVSSSFVLTTAGTALEWLSDTLTTSVYVTGHGMPAGSSPRGCWINAHLTDAESEAWRITGRPPAWVAFGGWAGELIVSSQDRDFSGAGTGNWNLLINSASVANTSNALDLTLAGSGASGVRLASAGIANYRPGALARVTFTASLISGSAIGMRAGFSGGTELIFTPTGSPTVYVGDVYLRNPVPTDNLLTFYAPGSNGSVIRLDDISVKYIGAISLPVVLPISALGDGTIFGDNPARLVGIQPVTTRRDWQLTARTATSGNEQLLGGSFLDTSRDVLDSIDQIPESGTPTSAVGSVSGGTQYKASGALAAGINTPALVTRKFASANVWNSSSTADPIRTTLRGHRI